MSTDANDADDANDANHNNSNDDDGIVGCACAALAVTAVVAASAVALDEGELEEEVDKRVAEEKIDLLADAVGAMRRIKRRCADGNGKKHKRYDYGRAHRCIQQDYLGEDALFGDKFERIFRITREMYDDIKRIASESDDFFKQRSLLNGERGICPDAKVLIGLKQLAYGVSPAAFLDYFQMGETTGRDCLKKLCLAISSSPELRGKYLRTMTREDAVRICELHLREFGVAGCLGCLDCMHVYWRTCPVAWQGQYKGKEEAPSIVLEAVADYTTWIWHAKFGFPGTLNDINIWDQSSLLREFLDGTFTDDIDFEFQIGEKTFDQLYFLVDGIYPDLSRFVKTLSVPITDEQKRYVQWQEGKRKAVERAFGILQRKFQILDRPVELWFEDEIKHIVETSIILHNMMVEKRILLEEDEVASLYDENWNDEEDISSVEDNMNGGDDDDDRSDSSQRQGNVDDGFVDDGVVATNIRERIRTIEQHWGNGSEERDAAVREAIQQHFENAGSNWDNLYNQQKHFELRQAIVDVINEY